MDLSSFSLSDLNVLIRSRLYRQVPELVNKILQRYVAIAQNNDCLGDEEFWKFALGEDEQKLQCGGVTTRSAAAQNESPQLNCNDFFQVTTLGIRESKKLRIRRMTFGLQLKNMDSCPNSHRVVLAALSSLIEFAFAGANQNDKVGLLMSHPGLNKKMGIPASTREMLTAEKVIAMMEKFMQSGDEVGYDERWTIEAVRISKPGG